MKTFSEIIEVIKTLKNYSKDSEVAELLGIIPKSLATAKLRNSIQYEELTTFCNNENVSLNWLLFGYGPQKILKNEYSDVKAPALNDDISKSGPAYTSAASDQLFRSDQKINIEEAMGKAYKVLNSGTALSVALYMNIQQFAAALDTGQELKACQEQIKSMQEQIDDLNKKVDRLIAPSTAERQGDGSEKKAM